MRPIPDRPQGTLELPVTTEQQPPTTLAETTGPARSAETWPAKGRLETQPATVGRYRVVELLGRGAFGCVYLAEDTALLRQVAIKLTRPADDSLPPTAPTKEAGSDSTVSSGEAQTLARLDHPAIVPVFDVGRTESGEHYVVAKYIRGCSLAQRMSKSRLTPSEAATIMARVCDGLHHAHQQGIVHRDIKPANILLDESGEPLVTDFGLALHEQQQRLRRGEVAGTPVYMSPEQVRGEAHHLDGRTDIWSAGIVLYEILAGRRPFVETSTATLFDEIASREPKPLRLIDPSIPEPLERIVVRCLRKNIADRYATAADVAADLWTWLNAEQVGDSSRLSAAHAGSTKYAVAGLVLACSIALIAVVAWNWFGRSATDALTGASPVTSSIASTPAPLDGNVSLRIWSPANELRRGRLLEEPGMLPLVAGDQIRVEATLSQPAYAYIVWIDAAGAASPVYPWRPGDWSSRPPTESKVTRLSLPDQIDSGWELEPASGMETLVLLARPEPLPDGVDLPALLVDLPAQPRQDARALVWLDDGRLATELTRAPRFFDARKIDDPLLAAQRILQVRLSPHFSLLRAVSFASSDQKP